MKLRKPGLMVLALGCLFLTGCGNTSDVSANVQESTNSASTRVKLSSLTVKTMPSKTTYKENEVFDPDGLVLTATYSDHSSKEITSGFTYSHDPLTTETKEITVSYSTKSVKVPITVTALQLKDFILATKTSLTFASRNPIDLSGLEFTATYEDDTTKTITVLDSEVKMKDEKGNAFTNLEPGSTLGIGEHTITVTYREKSAEVSLTIINGYRIEAENASNEANPTSDSYVRAKASANDTDYLTIQTNLDTGNGSICGIKEPTASAGQFLGGIKAGNVIEFNFTSSVAAKADVTIAASSNWVLKSIDNFPAWIGDIQVNEVFSATANNNPINISDDIILPGSGSQDATTGDKHNYRNFKVVNFGTMDIIEGLNTVTISFKTAEEMSQNPIDSITNKPKYQNIHNSNYGVPTLDYLQVTFQD